MSVGALVIANVVFHLLILLGAKYLGPYETMTASMSEESMKERSFALHGTAGDADTGVSIDLNEAEVRSPLARPPLQRQGMAHAADMLDRFAACFSLSG